MRVTWYNNARYVDEEMSRIVMLSRTGTGIPDGANFLPDGPLKDMGDAYFKSLPDVAETPLSPESFFTNSEWSWVDYAVAYGLLYPYAALFVFCMGIWGIIHLRKWLMRREFRMRRPCGHCDHLVFACAPRCPQCGVTPLGRADVSWLGFSSPFRARVSLPVIQERLRSHRRCPNCASFLVESKIVQSCLSCGVHPFPDARELAGYDRFIQKRCWWTVLLVFIIGWTPIIGPLLSGGLYKRTLIAPYSLYMNVFKESGLTVFLLVLRYLFRFLPFIGIIGLPLLALVEDFVYRKMFMMKGRRSNWKQADEV